MAGLLNPQMFLNPQMHTAMGLLSAGGPSPFPVGLGQALNQGFSQGVRGMEANQAHAMQQQRAALLAQETKQRKRQMEAAAKQQQAAEQLRGLLSSNPGMPVHEVMRQGLLSGALATNAQNIGGMAPAAPDTGPLAQKIADFTAANGGVAPTPEQLSIMAMGRAPAPAIGTLSVGGQGGLLTRLPTDEEAAALNIPLEDKGDYVVEGGKLKPKPVAKAGKEAAELEVNKAMTDYYALAKKAQGIAVNPSLRKQLEQARNKLAKALARKLQPSGMLTDKDIELELGDIPDPVGLVDKFTFEGSMNNLARLHGVTLPPPPGFVED